MTSKPTSKAAPKRSTTKAAITKPIAATKVAKPQTSDSGPPEMRKKELVERVVAESGMKKGDARRAIEAVFGVLAKVISEGTDISVPPLGKVRIVRKKDTPNGELAVLRVKLKDPNKVPKPKPDSDAVAGAAE